MKKIFKYIFISFGFLFLGSFFVVEKTYGDTIECYGTSECLCGKCCIGGKCLTCSSNPCSCTNSCSCGRFTGSCNCKPCVCSEDRCFLKYSSTGACIYTSPTGPSCVDGSSKISTEDPCVSACSCPASCFGDCNSDGSCSGGGGDVTNCSVYNSYCEDEMGSGSYSVWDSSSGSCICIKGTDTCPVAEGYETCSDGKCCPPGTYCGHDSSNNIICVLQGPLPTPPAPEDNEAPTAPTSLKTEGLTDPNNVSDTTPEFSAIFNDPNTGDNANYYQIQVTGSSPSLPLMWDSGKTSMAITAKGSRSPEISYSGTALTVNNALYYWKIKFWDVGGLESPWSAVSKFRTCLDTTCNPQDQCKPNGFAPVPISSDSILLEDIVSCNYSSACSVVKKYGDCYEDPHIKCTLDTDCDPGECCRGYSCTEDCSPVQSCTANSDCSTGKCCVGGECGECLSSKVRTVKVTMGSKESDIVRVGLWDRILAFFKNINTLFY